MRSGIRQLEDLDYEVFQRRIKQKMGIDLASYKRPQMERRLRGLIKQAGANSFYEYLRLLEENPALLEAFRQRMTINVSELFRNPDRFRELETDVVPKLLEDFGELKAWSAGCSYGAEAYSLAIVFQKLPAAAGRCSILATDIDDEMLDRAREGLFSEADMKNVNAERRRRFFDQEGDRWRVKPLLRQRLLFRHHDLLSDQFEKGFHLVLCRNVVIYLTDQAKTRLYQRLRDSLLPGGVLLIGSTEYIMEARRIGLEPFSAFFYRKVRLVSSEEKRCKPY